MVLTKHRTAPVPDVRARRPDTPPALAEAITRALAKAPEDRWATADLMRAAMASLAPA
jgi:serine/threonine-protein kinase